jgi:6-phosphofructokinase 1
MEDLELADEALRIHTLGPARIESPLQLSTTLGDNIANYVDDDDTVLLVSDRRKILARLKEKKNLPAFQLAGPRKSIYFDPSKTMASTTSSGPS